MEFNQPGRVIDSKPPPAVAIKSRPSLSNTKPPQTQKKLAHFQESISKKTLTVDEPNRESSFNSQKSRHSFLEDNPDQDILLKAIFSVDGKSSDVDLYENKITWKHITANTDETRRSSATSRRNSLANLACGETYEIPFERIFCVEPKCYQRTTSSKKVILSENFIRDEENTFEGFSIHVFDRLRPNYYEPRTLSFTHPHHTTCRKWLIKLYKRIKALQIEKRVLILINPYAGEKRTRSILNFMVSPLMELASITTDIIEFHNDKPLRDQLYHKNINTVNYYGILLICGDGSVSKIIHDLLEKQVYDDSHTRKLDLRKHTLKTPLCIMPAGTTNLIATSIYGSISLYTPLNYLIYGNCINIDISSIYTADRKLFNFGFGFSCGYGTDVARYIDKYSKLGIKKLQAALARAAAKKKTIVEIDIKYIPAVNYPDYVNQLRCYRGCNVCETQEKIMNGRTSDEVQDFDPLAESLHEIEENLGENYKRGINEHNSNEWRTISGKFMHVELLTNAMLWNMASGGGLSKHGHLADGCMDLILVDKVSRKEFMRFLRRHSNRKNQLELPFVKSIKVKECKIFIKNAKLLDDNPDMTTSRLDFSSQNESPIKRPSRMSDSDEDFNNNVYKFEKDSSASDQEENKLNTTHSIESTDKRGPRMYFIRKNESDELPSQSITMRKRSSSLQRSGHFILEKSKSIMNFFKTTENNENTSSQKSNSLRMRSGSALSQTKSNEKSKDESNYTKKSPYLWNIDWKLVELQNLHIKCERQYLTVFGCGIDLDTEYENSLNSCFKF